MPDPQTALPGTQKRIGDSKYLVGMLREADCEVADVGDSQLKPDEEMGPVLGAKPSPSSTKLSRHRTIMTPDLEHRVNAKSPVFMAPGGCRPPGKGAPLASPGDGKREDTP